MEDLDKSCDTAHRLNRSATPQGMNFSVVVVSDNINGRHDQCFPGANAYREAPEKYSLSEPAVNFLVL
jgi:hypothetical protein